MSTSAAEISYGSLRRAGGAWPAASRWKCGSPWQLSSTGAWREASLNWLALGLLLAAWNASDDDTATRAARRPEALRGYTSVSVRAAMLHSAKAPTLSMDP
jgi:hypothetical protein